MRTTLALMGAIILTGVGLVAAAGKALEESQPAAAEATAAPAAKPAAAPEAPAAPVKAEEKPIREAFTAFVEAYSNADAESLAAIFADEASVVDSQGGEVRGNGAIAEMYATSFRDLPGLKLESTIDEIRFLTPDVARSEGRSRLSTGTGDANEYTRFSGLLVRRDGKWRLAELRDYAVPVEDISAYDRLKELEWMVGDWVDEGADNKVSSSVRWADNNSFLVRTYKAEVQGQKATSGTMFIGWDPQTGQIKSWLFSSEGGHGEGQWTRTGETEWVVKAQGVLRDGRPTSATQIHTIVNKDAVKTSSIDRIVGGQIAPDIADVLMVKKAPAPAPASTPAKPATANTPVK